MTKKEELEQQGYKTYENDINHTGVRSEFEGRGIAKKLVLKVIEAARERGVKILPLCSYARKLMTGKEEYLDILT